MKKIITILFLLIAFVSNAQESFFKGNNNYVVPVIPFSIPAIVTNGLVSYLDAGIPSRYNGSGNTWSDLTGNGNHVTLTNTGYSSVNGGGIALNTNGYGTQTLANSPFNGDINTALIYKRGLITAEILHNYNALKTCFGL
jgi:hypothetical protein